MEPRISLVTLGVRDLPASLHFYRDVLGWPTAAKDSDPIAFFQLNGLVLGLYGRAPLADDAEVDAKGSGFRGFTLAYNVRSEREVDEVFAALKKTKTRIVKRPKRAVWGGYSGYFADPDGNLWEVAFNPGWKLDRKGNVRL